ncbi:hypothetical protein [Pelagerythrobacter rhizovicinus]|uniref:Uncharacterized protein n=1 Tax=Pelagerythrobacter rhizovicinus TaxID=2268576 RepID=A0A4V1QVY2_9SPHN|nr:hypothetical protein [Pelagerythrobacter rhizovicinus]RXZ64246.1 hypothetical protein ETX26_10055 [Pelagerythrobacter rhizovicinus]
MTNYLDEFPIPAELLPPRLFGLLSPVGTESDLRVDVTTRFEVDPYGPGREHVHMIMALASDQGPGDLSKYGETGHGVVYFSQPDVHEFGEIREFQPSVSGLDYIVASQGGGSFFAYHLAEKVWIALGLTPRVLGGDAQKLVYDDLSLPEFGVAEGEVSTEYHYTSKRNVNWSMSNAYLRRYLWMRGAYGVRLFFYQTLLPDCVQIRDLMQGETHIVLNPEGSWYDLDIREYEERLLIQVWAIVHAVEPTLCPEPTAEGLVWPGVDGAMTHARADALTATTPVHLNDQFLERYEQSGFFDTIPAKVGQAWYCSPSYLGQWSFTDCVRLGRNMVRVPLRELYKPKPDREILHAHAHVLTPEKVAEFDPSEEHIAGKTGRLASELLRFGEAFGAIGQSFGDDREPVDIVGLSRTEINANGWLHYPELVRLAQVAPLEMTEQAFLSRCKSIHEIWQKIPNAFLRNLLVRAGHTRADIKDLGSLKLLQALTNVLERLNGDGEDLDSFGAGTDPDDLTRRNAALAPLFINNELRIGDAHNAGETLAQLESLSFDIASVNQGFGKALDHVFDGVIAAFSHMNTQAEALLDR